jgi:transcriptional regulator with GAF, ATPase, and Fis domain
LPLWLAEGSKPGRNFFLSAGVHGDEINGIAVVQRFVETLALDNLHGCLVIVPIANVSGYEAGTREVPEDGKDLNRCMPGKPDGSLAERIAYLLFSEILPRADLGVDVHDAGKGSVLLPHPRIHDESLLDMAAAFGTDIIMRATLPPGYHGILSLEARKRFGRPFFHVEIGGDRTLWPVFVEVGVRGLRNLLVYSGMLPGQIELPSRQFLLPGRDDLAKTAPISGLLTQHVGLGDIVAEGQTLATIVNPFTSERVVVSVPHCGIVHALNLRGKVNRGDDVVGLLKLVAYDKAGEPVVEGTDLRLNQASSKVRIRESGSLIRRRGEADCNLSPSLQIQAPPRRFTTDNVPHDERLIGRSQVMRELRERIRLAAESNATVLILGETGTGKELVAEAIHFESVRKDKPLIKVNCSALPETLLESELFGHVKGAFTGAIKDKPGRFELAQGGTLLLDEIGDLSPLIQLKLLRVLQHHEFERVGESRARRVDVRIIVATHRDLRQLVAERRFREDLFYRLNVFPIHVPPLRERTTDIPLLVEHFLERFNGETGKSIVQLSDDVRHILMDFCWPGNVRQLENAIEHAFVTCQGPEIGLFDLPVEIRKTELRRQICDERKDEVSSTGVSCEERRRSKEPTREELLAWLEKSRYNKAEVARRAGVDRTTVWRWMKRFAVTSVPPEG